MSALEPLMCTRYNPRGWLKTQSRNANVQRKQNIVSGNENFAGNP
jgi:hypothetical protein